MGKGMTITRRAFGIIISILLVLPACGGGGGGGGADVSLPSRTLTWVVPTEYTDNTTIDNAIQVLDYYEVYIQQDNTFSITDNYVICAAVVGGTMLATSFDLRLAYAPLGLRTGVDYTVSMRVVTLTGAKSDFAAPSPAFRF